MDVLDGGLQHDSRERVFEALLAQHPDAMVAALDEDTIFVARPDLACLSSHPAPRGRMLLDLVAPADRMTTLDAWQRGIDEGVSRQRVRAPTGGADAILTVFDLRVTRGVFFAVLVPDQEGADSDRSPSADPAPRYAKTWRDEVGRIVRMEEAATLMLGWPPQDVLGRPALDMIHPEDQARAVDNWMDVLAAPGVARRWRGRHLRADGSWLWIEFSNLNLLSETDQGTVASEMVDITEEMAAQEALREREQLLHRLAEAVPVGLLQFDLEGLIVYTNERLHRVLGVEPAARVEVQLAHVVDEHQPALHRAMRAALSGQSVDELEIRLRLPATREVRVCQLWLRPLTTDAGLVTGALACVIDVTDSALMRLELEVRATTDGLTKCHNRASITAALERALATQRELGVPTAVIFVDLDRFKPVNDIFGHAIGDELLRIVANRLRGAVRDSDAVGRLGGDEFLVVCPGVTSPDVAMAAAQRVASRLRGEVSLGEAVVDVQASVGVAWAGGDDADVDGLLARADTAMYTSKREGRGRAVLFTDRAGS